MAWKRKFKKIVKEIEGCLEELDKLNKLDKLDEDVDWIVRKLEEVLETLKDYIEWAKYYDEVEFHEEFYKLIM